MLRKMGMNVVFVCCMALLSVFSAVNYPPLAGAQGVDSYTKLMLHADGSDQERLSPIPKQPPRP